MYISHFNEQQKNAVCAVNGPVLLLAVPGSGKTSVLVARLGYMVHVCGITPANILTVTYTKAATEEMKHRFAKDYGVEYAEHMDFRTINSLSKSIIDYYSQTVSKRPAFMLQSDEKVLKKLIRDIYRSVNDGEYPDESTIKDITAGITYAKNMMLSEDELESASNGLEHFADIYRSYNQVLNEKKSMDFDDQMRYALTILNTVPEVRQHFQKRYHYICVDESQDTSKIQHEIIHLLAKHHGNVFMVGDEDQSIYGFRAAYPDALMHFSEDYPGAKVLLIC